MMNDPSKQSLVKLTHDFIGLLMAQSDEEVDLTDAANRLGAAKRRLYDVTNVLAGIGLIERCGKAKVKWIGEPDTPEESEEIAELVARERELRALTAALDECLVTLSGSEDFQKYAWLSQNDIMRLSEGDQMSLFALRGPTDLTIEVPDEDAPHTHKIVCTSASGTIDLIKIHGA
jgi:transcription factor E2F3